MEEVKQWVSGCEGGKECYKAGVTGDAGGKQLVPGGAGGMKCVSGRGGCKAEGIWNKGVKEWKSQVKQWCRRQAVSTWRCRRKAQWNLEVKEASSGYLEVVGTCGCRRQALGI